MSGAHLLRRLLLALPTLFGVAVVVFVLLRVVPGDPIAMMIPPGARQADIENLRALYGLDRPIAVQFVAWLGALLQGDLGISISLRQHVLGLVLGHLPATIELALFALLIAAGFGLALALAATIWRGRWPELAVDGLTGLVQAIPDFLWALIFVLFLGVLWPILPISGRIDPRLGVTFVSQFYLVESLVRLDLPTFLSLVTHLVLPAAALA